MIGNSEVLAEVALGPGTSQELTNGASWGAEIVGNNDSIPEGGGKTFEHLLPRFGCFQFLLNTFLV